ncbi:MAG: DUF1002 domain-containing protein [Bacilli bacterium]
MCMNGVDDMYKKIVLTIFLFFSFGHVAYGEGDYSATQQKALQNGNVEDMLNQEISSLREQLGVTETQELITAIRDGLKIDMPLTEQEMKQFIGEQAEQLGIPLVEQQLNDLTDLFLQIKDMNVNWDALNNQLQTMTEQVQGFVESEKGQTFFQEIVQGFKTIIDAVLSLF